MSKYVLKRFGQLVKAIDQTDPKVEGHVRKIFDKLMHGIGTCYYEISFRSPSGRNRDNTHDVILQTAWCKISEQERTPRHLIHSDHGYTDQTAYAYFESKELWIYADDPGALLSTCKTPSELKIKGDSAEDIPN